MDTKFVNKNKICISAAIILIILLSQYKSYKIIIHTILGRFILVILILAISNSSVFCGIVAVLYVIIMINQNDEIYLEGFGEEESLMSSFEKNLAEIGTSTPLIPVCEGSNITEIEDTIRTGKNSKQLSSIFNKSVTDISPSINEDSSIKFSIFN
jgi:hypothetical protein